VPAFAAVTTAPLFVIIDESLVDHVPPAVALASVVARPWQTVKLPVIAAGFGLTDITFVARQPFDSV
jgi:hypothetical protein